MKLNRAFLRNPGNDYSSRAIFVTDVSVSYTDRSVKPTLTGTLVFSADPDQKPQNAESDQGLYCLLKLQGIKG